MKSIVKPVTLAIAVFPNNILKLKWVFGVCNCMCVWGG
jgi:hypothetical protein